MGRACGVAATALLLAGAACRKAGPPASGSSAASGSRAPAAIDAAAKLATLEEIFKSRNDNDPRLDGDFNALSPEAKHLFRKKYEDLPREARNERGTIVYLIGRNLRTAEDWGFLREAAAEPPCLSLADCSKAAAASESAGAAGEEVTLAYPALVALKQAERALDRGGSPDDAQAREALGVVRAAIGSKSPVVARAAARLEARYGAAFR